MWTFRTSLLAMVIALAPGFAAAQKADPLPWPLPPDFLVMQSVEDLDQDTFQPRLGNGSVANPADWPATFIAAGCTATLVGARALLTAAHCISDGGRVQITSRNRRYEGTCEAPHPGYPQIRSADWM